MDLICYAALKCQWFRVHEYVQKNSLTQICSLQKDDSVGDAHIVGIRS